MRTIAAIALAAAGLLALVPLTATGQAEAPVGRHYTVHCADPAGTQVVARAFSAAVYSRGGHVHAIQLLKQKHPSWICWSTGPHPDRPAGATTRG
jgi:hypothetical protein